MAGPSEELWDARLDDGAGDPVLDAADELAADVARCRAAAAALAHTLRRLGSGARDRTLQRALDGLAPLCTAPPAPAPVCGTGGGTAPVEGLQLCLELLCRDARAAAAAMEQCAAVAALAARRAATFQQQVARATAMNRLAYAKLCAVVSTETRHHARPDPSARVLSPQQRQQQPQQPQDPKQAGPGAPLAAAAAAAPVGAAGDAGERGPGPGPGDAACAGHVIAVSDLLPDDEDAAARDQLLSDVGKHILNTELQADGSAASLDDDDRAAGCGGGAGDGGSGSGGRLDEGAVGAVSTDELERTSAAILGNVGVLEALLGLAMDTLSVGGTTCHTGATGAPTGSSSEKKTTATATATVTAKATGTGTGTARTCAVRDVAVQTEPLRTADLCQMIERSVAPTEQCTLQ